MLPVIVFRGRLLLGYNICKISSIHTWNRFVRWQDLVKREKDLEIRKSIRRKWLSSHMYLEHDDPNYGMPEKHPEDMGREELTYFSFDTIANQQMLRYLDRSPDAVRRHKRYMDMVERQYDQRFIAERHLYLGSELATAHFIVHRDGKIKFLENTAWHCKDKEGNYSLPGQKVVDVYVEGVDASGTELMFEGFDNMTNLKKIRFLSVADCKYMNDWCLGRMNQFEQTLEYLDLSRCKKISASGLSALACLKKLKYLRLDGLSHVKDIAKVALFLEDSIPDLQVIGLDYDYALDKLEDQLRLMEHPLVNEDARGNLHIQDDCGTWYYVGGNLDERPVVDEDDLPLVQTMIRPDPPELPLEQLQELNELSQGKLKHLLVGSPSGLSWTGESERILSFEAKKLVEAHAEVHPFMLPDGEGKKALPDGQKDEVKKSISESKS